MEKSITGSGKSGRSAMGLGPVARRQTGAPGLTTPLRGLVFIGTGDISTLPAALDRIGTVVARTAPAVLDTGQEANVLFCVVPERAFDRGLETLRGGCIGSAVSGVAFFGDADVPDQRSVRSLARMTSVSGVVLGSRAVRVRHPAQDSAGHYWMDLRDLSRLRLGQGCPALGADVPQTVRVRLQSLRACPTSEPAAPYHH